MLTSFLSLVLTGQSPLWEGALTTGARPGILKQNAEHRIYKVNRQVLQETVLSAELSALREKAIHIIELPLPDGRFQKFSITAAEPMAPELSAAFPQIRSYNLKGIDDHLAGGKLDINETGFYAMVVSPQGDYFIDPVAKNNSSEMICYYRSDLTEPAAVFCEPFSVISTKKKAAASTAFAPCIEGTLYRYRLAVACTHQYASAVTGTANPSLAQTLSKIVVTVNRVNGIYERELSISLQLVPTTTAVIFTTAAADPFTQNFNTAALLGESQKVIDSIIGDLNYDLGHTFSTSGGGLGYVGSVCSPGFKALGVSGNSNPSGDAFDVDYVAHEIGHQFGASHTFNAITGNCSGNRVAISAVEPGSGITIMGYAGICNNNNLGNNSLPYFHGASYDQIIQFTRAGNAQLCASTITVNNQAPVIAKLPDEFIIPRGTPFFLEGLGIDPDGDQISYSWEEMDRGAAAANWNADVAPYFRSYAPAANGRRIFPSAEVLKNGNYTGTPGEFLSSKEQTLKFRLTVRDNNTGGGAVCHDSTRVRMSAAGPFSVTVPDAPAIVWGQRSTRTIRWQVNGSNEAPVNCALVNILCSLDDGDTYQLLVANTANDGSEPVKLPAVETTKTKCRILVECEGNIFFDVSNNPFTITTDSTVGAPDERDDSISFKVWPNPVKNELAFAFESRDLNQPFEMRLYDISGRIMLYESFDAATSISGQLRLEGLEGGIYLFELRNGAFKAVKRVIKE